MKILIISDAWHPQVNGVVRTYEHIISRLEQRGHDIKVISPSDFKFKIPLPGYTEIKLALTPYKKLKRMIKAYKPEAIHIATEGPLGWAARKYCLRNQQEFTTCYHTQFPDYVAQRVRSYIPSLYDYAYNKARNYVYRFHAPSSEIFVATQSIEDQLAAWNFPAPMTRLTRGADLELFTPGAKTEFKDLKTPIALYVGRVALEKNLEAFLAMDWHGSKVVVGDGPSMGYLINKYPDASFIGRKTGADLAACYRSADLFVFPSKTDTFGIVLVEAMACGLPIAGYTAPGPKDIITEGFLGALDDNNLEQAAQKALECGTPEQRAAHAKSTYTWDIAANQFEQALSKNINT